MTKNKKYLKQVKEFDNNFHAISDICDNINDFLNLDYDLNLLERIENNEPINKIEYIYYEYSLPLKLSCMNHLMRRFKKGDPNEKD